MKIFSRLLYWARKRRYQEGAKSLDARVNGQVMEVRPVRIVGASIIGQDSRSQSYVVISYQTAIDKTDFLRTWYALGGEPFVDGSGNYYDPQTFF